MADLVFNKPALKYKSASFWILNNFIIKSATEGTNSLSFLFSKKMIR